MEALAQYGPAIKDLLLPPRLNPLDGGVPNEAARARLEALRPETVCAPRPVRDRSMASCCLAGLWLYHNFLDESHHLSQNIETPTGSYWHGLMHRREPDFANAAYWFRQVGPHPIFEPLHRAAFQAAATASDRDARIVVEQPAWDPFGFVELCERVVKGQSACAALCRQIQQREWELLFAYSYRGALGED